MKGLLVLLITTVSIFSQAAQFTATSSDGTQGVFKSAWSCRIFNSDLQIAINCATGSGIRDSFEACKAFPCEICAVRSMETTYTFGGSNDSFSRAEVETILDGKNCGRQ